MKINSVSLTLLLSGKPNFSLNEISINQLKIPSLIENLLNSDRACAEIYPESKVKIPNEILNSANTPWGWPLGIHKKDINSALEITTPGTFAIYLEEIELLCNDKLLIYKKNLIIKEYLGESYHASAMKWLKKEKGKGIFRFAREKKITDQYVEYESGIDFSTEPGDTNVYHWIARVLPKLKAILQLPNSLPLIFSYQPTQFQKQCLDFFNIKNPILVVDPSINAKFKKFVLIEGPWAVANRPQEDWLIKAANSIITTKTSQTSELEKIYVHRAESSRRKILNQYDVIQQLKKWGHTPIMLEDRNFIECIQIFSNAKSIVFEHGASGIWLLFTRPDVNVIELLPEKNHISSKEVSNYYFWLCKLRNKKIRLLICKNQKLNPWAEYLVDLNQLEKEMANQSQRKEN
jgi:capsular polysaccharide biosynthesis protein